MILLLDLGNSKVKWGVADNGEVFALGSADYNDSLVTRLGSSLREYAARVDSVAGVSVVSAEKRIAVEQEVQLHCQLRVSWFHSVSEARGVQNSYASPASLGADRWAALIAARGLAPQGACIMDVGTALTVDGLDERGKHLGGAIFPGADALLSALGSSTAQIDFARGGEVPAIPAASTREGVLGGVFHGFNYVANGLSAEIASICPEGSAMFVTGGGACGVLPFLSRDDWQYREHMVIEGVARLVRGVDCPSP